MPARGGAGNTGTLGRQGGIEALALGVKTLQHGHALGQAGNQVRVGDGRFQDFKSPAFARSSRSHADDRTNS
jgi:hypothetical protein